MSNTHHSSTVIFVSATPEKDQMFEEISQAILWLHDVKERLGAVLRNPIGFLGEKYQDTMNNWSDKIYDDEKILLIMIGSIQDLLDIGRVSKGDPWYQERKKIFDTGLEHNGRKRIMILGNLLLFLKKELL